MAIPNRAATISEIMGDLQTIMDIYGDVGVYVIAPVEGENCESISVKPSFIPEIGAVQALIIA